MLSFKSYNMTMYQRKLQSALIDTGKAVEAMKGQPTPDEGDLILTLHWLQNAMQKNDMRAMRKHARELGAMVVKLQVERL